MVKLEEVFLSDASGFTSGRHRVWPVGVVLFDESVSFPEGRALAFRWLPLPHEKRGRADVVRAGSE